MSNLQNLLGYSLLVVSTSESGVIVLVNADGIQLLCSTENCLSHLELLQVLPHR